MTSDAKDDRSPLLSRWLSTAPRDAPAAPPAPVRRDEAEAEKGSRSRASPSVRPASPEERPLDPGAVLAALKGEIAAALPPRDARVLVALLAPIEAALAPKAKIDPKEIRACFEQVEDVLEAFLLRPPKEAGEDSGKA
jgi:hypothetical protein